MSVTATWKWAAAAVVCAGALGAGGVLAFTSGGSPVPLPNVPAPLPLAANDPAPQPKSKPTDDEWIPKPAIEGPARDKSDQTALKTVPSAFPELAVPEPDRNDLDGKKRLEQFEKLCPRLFGKTVIAIAPDDDTLRKVLKARLHQVTFEIQWVFKRMQVGSYWQHSITYELLSDIRAIATELWGGQPKELIPWLEESVLIGKEVERYSRVRVLNGNEPPQAVYAASRHRLAAEAALLKAKARP